MWSGDCGNSSLTVLVRFVAVSYVSSILPRFVDLLACLRLLVTVSLHRPPVPLQIVERLNGVNRTGS